MSEISEYLTVEELIDRGWTRNLIKIHLGPPDRLFPVDHWLNGSGKKAWLYQTVELVEMTQGFEASYLRGAKIRKLSKESMQEVIDRIYDLREGIGMTQDLVEAEWQRRINACASTTAEHITEARRRGYRTPHKL